MNKAKFLIIIRSLNKKDFKEFGKFVLSPVYNTNPAIIKLYNYLKTISPGLKEDKLSKELVYREVFGKEKLNERKLRNLSSEMLTLLNEFLVYTNVRDNTLLKNKLYLEQLSKIENDYITEKVKKDTKQILNSADLSKYPIEDILSFLDLLINIESGKYDKNVTKEFEKILEHINIVILNLSLRYFSTGKLITSAFKHKFNTDFLLHVCSYIEKLDLKTLPIMTHVYYYLFKLRTEKSEEYYFKLKDIFLNKKNGFSRSDESSICQFLLNFLTEERTIENFERYCNEEYELRKQYINSLIDKSKYMQDSIFMNFVLLCIRLKKFSEAEEFIEKNSSRLNPGIMSYVINISRGKLYSAKGMFKEAISAYSRVKYNHWYYRLQALSNLAMCFYEINDFNSVLTVTEQLTAFCNKNKQVYPFMKKNQKTFAKRLVQFLDIKNESDKEKLVILLEDINTSPRFSYKEWLCAKISAEIKKAP